MASERFTVASIPERARGLTDTQQKLFDYIWNYYVSTGEACPLRVLTVIIETQPEKEALRGLNGSLLRQKNATNEPVYELAFQGALLTPHGPVLIALLLRLLDLTKELYRKNRLISEIRSDEVKHLLEIPPAEINLFGKLLRLFGVPGLPIYISSMDANGSTWTITVRHSVVNLYRADNTEAYLDNLLSEEYDPNVPILEVERNRYFLLPRKGMAQESEFVDPTRLSPPLVRDASQSNKNTGESASSAYSATRTETEAERDLLGREKLTQALCRLLTEREDEDAFAVGLFGHWGVGKSSQINFLEGELKKSQEPEFRVAEFNAWKHEKADNLAAMLAQSVVDALVAEKSIWEKLRLAFHLAVLRNVHNRKNVEKWKRRLAGFWVLSPYLIPFVPFIVMIWLVPGWATYICSALGVIGVMVLGGYHFLRSQLTEWFKHIDYLKKTLAVFSLPDYSAHRGLVLDIHRMLEDLCGLCLKGDSPKEGGYLLVVVDDLDRCGVEAVKNVLDAVRLVANIKRVVTLVAIDERIAFAAVEKHYNDSGHGGRAPELVARDYLAKVLQVSVRLPDADDDLIASYVDKKIFVDAGARELTPGQEKANGETPIPDVAAAKVEPAPSPDTQPAPEVKEAPVIQPFLPEEKNLFKKLAKTYGFANPRLLGRINMAWKLLKSLHFGPESKYDFGQAEIPMRLLFWKEWLHQQPSNKRQELSEWMQNKREKDFSEVSLPEWPDNKLRQNWEKAKPVAAIVEAVLLPANPIEPAEVETLK